MSQQLLAEEFDKSRRVGNVTDSGTFGRNLGHQLKMKPNTAVASLLKIRVNVQSL